ncbi:MAG: hypothetical protein A2163_00795 [Actinobacteria bacterium RBG_13_35_12]|nr:MAG: hypothetical protein A2163_00795 [Actinobacteria bacterium RBG_13_35_12]
MNAVLIGYGDIGKSLYEVLSPYHKISITDMATDRVAEGTFDILLIAIPFSPVFVPFVEHYQRQYTGKGRTRIPTLIFSTVAIGISDICAAYHSPIEGRHTKIVDMIRRQTYCIGKKKDSAMDENLFIATFFEEAKLKYDFFDNAKITEFLKLRSTALFGVNIEFARYSKQVADDIGMDFELVKEYDKAHNRLCREVGMDYCQRYILDPPEGEIKGHCVVPNSIILDEQYPSVFLKEIYRPKGNKII